MELTLSRSAREWQAKARNFAEQELQPWELEAEFNNGVIPTEVRERHRQLAVELGFSRMDVPERYGGLALGMTEQVAIWEQLKTYILPLLDGSRGECYAITEAESGSWEVINSLATRCEGGFRLNGEKRYVTSANRLLKRGLQEM